MPEIITIDDLPTPTFSPEGQAVLDGMAKFAPAEFTIDAMIAAAEKRLDVPLFRDEYMLDNLARFIKEGDEKGPYTEAGRTFHYSFAVSHITQRSRLEALFQRHPEIADIKVDRPLIIAGMPRSGTTHLSNLIAADSRLNSLYLWESSVPIPPIDVLESGAGDTRMTEGQKNAEVNDWVVPYFKNMLDMGWDSTIEEIQMWGMLGLPLGHLNMAENPDWRHWFWHQMDPEGLYVFQKRCMQALQWMRGNEKRWLLKTPHHLAFLPTIKKIFPDASIVITHRDPASSVISNATMIAYLYRWVYADVDLEAAYQNAVDMGKGMLGGLVRDIDQLGEAHHVYFHQYMKDVDSTLKDIYAWADLPWTDTAQTELNEYIDTHPRGRFGRLKYNPQRDFGRSRDEIRAPFQFYLDKFPKVKVEEKHG